MEGEAVDDGGDEAWVGDDGAPFAEREVAAAADGGAFFSFGDDLEEQLGASGVELDLAELLEAQQVEAAVAGHDAAQATFVGRFDQLVDPVGRR